MDFFEAQARAKKRTTRLVTLFVFAVAGTVLASYLAAAAIQGYARGGKRHTAPLVYWDPQLCAGVTAGILAIVGLAALFKWLQLRAGGSAVAEMVGGRRVDLRTTEHYERRLLNIVEEMAIASGITVPAVYILDDEPSLNAFAAGLTPGDAVVAVTRGTLEKLSRDELQGVVAHEFSHILNGDMRLNVRITAVLFGILVLGLLGRGLLETMARTRPRGKDKGGGIAFLLLVGLALMIIGYVGYFFGRLIQAAVSRQREFLADASAVQFTRNPAGIGGALKKIGGYALGSQLQTSKAAQIGHFFFAQGFSSYFGGLWATHPPLDERIRAIEPQWDGKLFAPPEVVDVDRESFRTAGFAPRVSPEEAAQRAFSAPAAIPAATPAPRSIAFVPAAVIASAGALTEGHFRRAQSLLENVPVTLREATRDTARAPLVAYGLLLSADPAGRARQLELVRTHAGDATASALAALLPEFAGLAAEARLPLLQLCLPALRPIAGAELERFVSTLDELVHADAQVSPFEFALQKVLLRSLQLGRAPQTNVEYYSFQAVVNEIAVVLSALVHAGTRDPAQALTAFATGATQLKLIEGKLALLAPEACALTQLDPALDRLAVASLPIKKRLLAAAATAIGADSVVTPEEAEFYRALAAALDVPMPVWDEPATAA
ncbi:MAG: M48 family metallopeptidase [Opitutae bacterium]|nr:M48 family metallopeptidase [Opitutae bacterium]